MTNAAEIALMETEKKFRDLHSFGGQTRTQDAKTWKEPKTENERNAWYYFAATSHKEYDEDGGYDLCGPASELNKNIQTLTFYRQGQQMNDGQLNTLTATLNNVYAAISQTGATLQIINSYRDLDATEDPELENKLKVLRTHGETQCKQTEKLIKEVTSYIKDYINYFLKINEMKRAEENKSAKEQLMLKARVNIDSDIVLVEARGVKLSKGTTVSKPGVSR